MFIVTTTYIYVPIMYAPNLVYVEMFHAEILKVQGRDRKRSFVKNRRKKRVEKILVIYSHDAIAMRLFLRTRRSKQNDTVSWRMRNYDNRLRAIASGVSHVLRNMSRGQRNFSIRMRSGILLVEWSSVELTNQDREIFAPFALIGQLNAILS